MPSILKRDLEADYKLLLSWRYDKVDFLGLPSLRQNRPLTLEEIYVPLSFSWEPGGKEHFYLPKALEHSRRLVVLGDPGSGKSTLIKLITYSFGRSEPTPLSNRFGPLLPVPIILRDYPVPEWKTKEDMLQAFIDGLDEEIRPLITVEWLMAPLRQGRGFLLVDGLDEVGDKQDRKHLRDEIIAPLLLEIDSRVIVTSRTVGYDDVPLEGYFPAYENGDDWYETMTTYDDIILGGGDPSGAVTPAHLYLRPCYVAPFSADDIEQFVTRWYAVREPEPDRRREGIQSLQAALAQNERIKQLAGNPSLLTIIALVHRVTAQLPSGRVKLYDKIVEAYLETIQTYRKLDGFPASLDQMKRWLARIGWEMQVRRREGSDVELLASRETVLEWLKEAMAVDRAKPEEEGNQFLDYVARRSGLLVERAHGEFSFVHLTFQEYFAAFHLRGMVRQFDRLAEECASRLDKVVWRETFVLLFEMLAEFPGAGDDLLAALEQRADTRPLRQAAGELFSALLLDDQSGLSLGSSKRATVAALSSAAEQCNSYIIGNLRQLPTARFDPWVREWLTAQLEEAPEAIPRDFFLIGAALVDDWPRRLEKVVHNRDTSSWSDQQTADVVLVARGNLEVCEWAVRAARPQVWVKTFQHWASGSAAMADYPIPCTFRLVELDNAALAGGPGGGLRHRFLHDLRGGMCLASFLWVRHAVFIYFEPRMRLFWPPDTAMVRALFMDSLPAFAGLMRSLDLAVILPTPALLRSAARYLIREGHAGQSFFPEFLAEALASGRTSPIAQPSDPLSEAEAACFAADASADELATVVNSLQRVAQSPDDWNCLLAVSGLLALGRGTPALCSRWNELLAKGIKTPNEFTFPSELSSESERPEFRQDLPQVLRLAFLYVSDNPWPLPAFLEPSGPGARFLLSTPREFYAVAAEALDPEGKTDLSKWRIPR